MVHLNPIIPNTNIIYDYDGNSTKFSTFLDNETIFAQADSQFIRFDSSGTLIDTVNFEGHSTEFKGEDVYTGADTIHYIAYWHEYLCSKDTGINQQVFVGEDQLPRAEIFIQNLEAINKLTGILVKIDKNKGLEFINSNGSSHWDKILRDNARLEYQSRFLLVKMSVCNNYYLFFDRFMQKYNLWAL